MQDHTATIFQCDELGYREILRTRVGGARWPEVADSAKTHDAARLDRRKAIGVAIRSVRMRAPASLITAHPRDLGAFPTARSLSL